MSLLTEDEQVVNAGTPEYTKALEGSASKTFNADSKMPLQVDLVSTRFALMKHLVKNLAQELMEISGFQEN